MIYVLLLLKTIIQIHDVHSLQKNPFSLHTQHEKIVVQVKLSTIRVCIFSQSFFFLFLSRNHMRFYLIEATTCDGVNRSGHVYSW